MLCQEESVSAKKPSASAIEVVTIARPARRIVAAAGEVSYEDASALLERAGGEVKTAIVMARLNVDADAARERLRAARGHVRAALGEKRRRKTKHKGRRRARR